MDKNEKIQFQCVKCGCKEYDQDQFQATGGNVSKMFNVQNRKFITISCKECGYTELYKAHTSRGANILDFLMN